MNTDYFVGSKAGGGKYRNIPDNLRSTDTFEAILGIVSNRARLAPGGLQNLFVDGVPIEDGQGNAVFKDFIAELFDGDPTVLQPVTLRLGQSSGQTNVGLTLANAYTDGSPGDWVTATMPQVGVNFVDVRLIVQQLVAQTKNGVGEQTASIEIQMRPSGATTWTNPLLDVTAPVYQQDGIVIENGNFVYIPGIKWDGTNWADPNPGYLTIQGKTSSAYVKELRIAVPNTGAYASKSWQIRMRLIERDYVVSGSNGENEDRRTIQWESVAGALTTPLGGTEAWRGLSYLQIYGKATDQISGLPEMTGVYDIGEYIVPASSVWDPVARTFSGAPWDGVTTQLSWTQCPAWQIKGLIEDDLSGVSALVPGSTLNKWDVLEASRWFAERVPDGQGGEHPRYSMDWIIEQPMQVQQLINHLAGAVGAFSWDEGDGRWRLKVERPENPVNIFTKENIVGEFSYSHTDFDTRFNDYIGVFRNSELGYKEDRVRVWNQASIDTTGRRHVTVPLIGCTNRQEALRRLYLRLLSSLFENRSVTFVTNRQGRLLEPLSVIAVADGDLNYDTAQRSTGRIVSTNGPRTQITLRDTVRIEPGVEYSVSITVPNPAYDPEPTAQPEDGIWRQPTITLTRNLTNTLPQRGDVKVLYLDNGLPESLPEFAPVALSATGLPALPKQYRVLSVSPNGENSELVTIVAHEIYTSKWAESDEITEDELNAQPVTRTVPPPEAPEDGVFSVVQYESENGPKVVLVANWLRPGSMFLDGYRISLRHNAGPWQDLGRTQDTFYEITAPVGGIYEIEVYTRDRRGLESAPLQASYEYDELALPGSVSPGGNRVHFSLFEAGTKGWEILSNPGSLTALLLDEVHQGYKTLSLYFEATAASQTVKFGTDYAYRFPVTPAERLAVQALVGGTMNIDQAKMYVAWYDDSGDIISTSLVATMDSPSATLAPLQGFVEAPAGALLGELQLEAVSSGAGDVELILARPMISQAAQGQTTFPSFLAGPNADNGATRLSFRGDWEEGDEYREGDVVNFSGISYGCKLAHIAATDNQPPNATFWAVFSTSVYSAMLTNESHVVSANALGTVGSFDNAGGDFKIYVGGTEVTSGITFSVASEIGVDVSIGTDGTYVVNAMSADQGTAVLRAVVNDLTFDKVYSISKSRSGSTGITLMLTNEAHVVPTDSAGNNGDFSEADGQLIALTDGADLLPGLTIGTAVASGCTGQVNTANNTPINGKPKGYYRVTAMNADTATLTIPVTIGGTTLETMFSLTKSKSGASVRLTADREKVTYNGAGSPNPTTQNTVFTVELKNATGTVSWEYATATGSFSPLTTQITIAGDTLSASMTRVQFEALAGGTASARIKVRYNSTLGWIEDYVTITKVSDGAQGAPGASAKNLILVSDRLNIKYDGNGAATPSTQTTNLIIQKQNTSATVFWELRDLNGVLRTPTTSFLSSASGDSTTMTRAQFESACNGTQGVTITASLFDGTTLSDQRTILKSSDGSAALGFVQDSPTPSATFVNQTWYKPTTKTWWRAQSIGTGGWTRMLGDLSGLDAIDTSVINPNAVTQTIGNVTALTASISGALYPDLYCVSKLNITTAGWSIHVIEELITELFQLGSVAAGTSMPARFAITRGLSTVNITLLPSGSATSLASYLSNSGTLQLMSPAEIRRFTQAAAASNVFSSQENTSFAYVDAPPAGVFTYAIWMGPGNANVQISTRIRQYLKLMEVKK